MAPFGRCAGTHSWGACSPPSFLAAPPLNDDVQPSSAVSSPTQQGPVLYMPSAAGDSVPVSPSSPHAPDLSAVRACPGSEWVGTLPAQERAPAFLCPRSLRPWYLSWGQGQGGGGCILRASSDQPGQQGRAGISLLSLLSVKSLLLGSGVPECLLVPTDHSPLKQGGRVSISQTHCTHCLSPTVLFCSSSVGIVAWAVHLTSAAPRQAPAGRPQTWRAWSSLGSLALPLAATRKLLALRGKTRSGRSI